MGKLREPLRYLDREEMELIHQGALQILARVGMRVESHEALDYLAAAGCRVNRETMLARFPESVTQAAVERMRAAFADPKRIPEKMAVRYSQVYFSTMPHQVHSGFTANTGGFCVFIYDLEGRRRPANLDDVRASIRLADALENVDFMGLPVSAQEVPHPMRPVVMAAELVKHTKKLGGIETFDRLDVQFITRIAEIVAGSAEALRREPRIAQKARFVGMHGSVRKGYNGKPTPDREWNVVANAKAAQKAFTAAWPMRITPLDTCGLVRLKGDKYRKIAECKDPLTRAVIENHEIWFKAGNPKSSGKPNASSVLFDTVAVYLAFSDKLVNIERLPIRVTDDGFTRIDPAGKQIDCAMSWKDLGAYEDFLVARFTGKP